MQPRPLAQFLCCVRPSPPISDHPLSTISNAQLFKDWDISADGLLSRDEFMRGVAQLGLSDASAAMALFDSWDLDGSSTIEFAKLNRVLRRGLDMRGVDEDLHIIETTSRRNWSRKNIDGASSMVVHQVAEPARRRPQQALHKSASSSLFPRLAAARTVREVPEHSSGRKLTITRASSLGVIHGKGIHDSPSRSPKARVPVDKATTTASGESAYFTVAHLFYSISQP